VKLMHGVIDRGLGRMAHAVCTEDGRPLVMTAENVERLVNCWNSFEPKPNGAEPREESDGEPSHVER